jgi:hypothetical protein
MHSLENKKNIQNTALIGQDLKQFQAIKKPRCNECNGAISRTLGAKKSLD